MNERRPLHRILVGPISKVFSRVSPQTLRDSMAYCAQFLNDGNVLCVGTASGELLLWEVGPYWVSGAFFPLSLFSSLSSLHL
jgi:hypothetical protein